MENPTGKRVKLKIDGEKYVGTVVQARTEAADYDVTMGGLYGQEPDTTRRTVPGRRKTTLTIELEG